MLTIQKRNTVVNKQGINVLLVEDHHVVRQHMKRSFSRIPGVAVVREAANGQDALDLALSENFDAVLLDILLPDTHGLEILAILRSKRPNLPVLMFSMYPEIPHALQMLKAGAAGYLNKETVLEHLANAIRKVSEGGLFISPNLAQYLSSAFAGDPVRTFQDLLPDQAFQVMTRLRGGHSAAEIANEMRISEAQVNKIRSHLLDLTGLASDVELMDFISRKGLINDTVRGH